MSNPPVNNKRDLGQLLQDINKACAVATVDFQRLMTSRDMAELPHTYVIPEIEVEISVTLTSEPGGLRALVNDKDTTQTASRLKFKYVAAPRVADPASG